MSTKEQKQKVIKQIQDTREKKRHKSYNTDIKQFFKLQ